VARQHVAGEDHQQLVPEQDVALAIHHADAVAVAVEGDAEVGLLARHLGDELLQVLRHRGIGVVGRELPSMVPLMTVWVPGISCTMRATISPEEPLPGSQTTLRPVLPPSQSRIIRAT
jgi:hypothetical protein